MGQVQRIVLENKREAVEVTSFQVGASPKGSGFRGWDVVYMLFYLISFGHQYNVQLDISNMLNKYVISNWYWEKVVSKTRTIGRVKCPLAQVMKDLFREV